MDKLPKLDEAIVAMKKKLEECKKILILKFLKILVRL